MKSYKKHIKKISFVLGPLLFFIIQNTQFNDLSDQGRAVLACTVWIALWWLMETVELVVTSLLPIVIFPLSGALTIGQTTESYGNPYIYLFLGGFIMGMAIEHWNLHKRIAYKIIGWVGLNEKRVLLGIMLATAFLSMWISNTATAIMMLPIGMSLIHQFEKDDKFSKSIMLGIAYAASIGGIATLIGTPPNIILAGIVKESLGIEISFFSWMVFGVPLSAILLLTVWFLLAKNMKSTPIEKPQIQSEIPTKMSSAEKRVLLIVGFAAFLWITRSFIWSRLIPQLDDTIIAISGALLMLIIPAGTDNKRLMDWKKASTIPWSVLILFGAGLAIAKGFSSSDLTQWMGNHFAQLNFLPGAVIVLLILLSINFLTEITSNTASASILLPILITLTASLNIETIPILAGAAISASCAFMLPVATPPNAIVFSSGKITIHDMIKTGFVFNLLSVLIVYLFIQFFWEIIF